jgi:hypothetical protein
VLTAQINRDLRCSSLNVLPYRQGESRTFAILAFSTQIAQKLGQSRGES